MVTLPAIAQTPISAPDYSDCYLVSIYPAGGQRGQSVAVELRGGYFPGAKEILIDGPPGISVKDIKLKSNDRDLDATFVIAPDAPLGRRCVRVLNERCGLSNMLYFSVGRLPEVREVEPNNDAAAPQAVALPVVVNGRVDPGADVDGYAFDLKAGERIIAAAFAHALDSHGQGSNYGFVDCSLQLVDPQGRIVAEAGDTLGLDPQIEFTTSEPGRYAVRVFCEAYAGFPQAVYRLVLGDLALATSVFPLGGRRQTAVDVHFSGPGILQGAIQKIVLPADDPFPLQFVIPEFAGAADLELPLVRGELPETIEAEPNDALAAATSLTLPMTANGRVDRLDDEDWYRLPLAAGQNVVLETTAHRLLRSPIDTLIEVFDAAGTKLAENDDGIPVDYISMHDFKSTDSRATFAAQVAGDYFVRVTDQSGGFGSRAAYRLTARLAEPDFALWLHPDNVPIWGPGSTAAMVVKMDRFDGLNGDIKLSVEGLPPGWIGSETTSCGPQSAHPNPYPHLYSLLTITAPPDAKPCDWAPLNIVGRAEVNGKIIERVIQPLTLYYTTDIGLFRMSPVARAAVAKAQTPWLSTEVKEISAPLRGKFEIPVTVHNAGDQKTIDLAAQISTSGVSCALNTPQTVAIEGGKAVLPITLPDGIVYPGPYGITVALRWGGDIRGGMPGPCTPLIRLNVTPTN